jgi:hypothetical protein
MSEIKVNKISQRSGTAITLGNSGTDFQLPSGADIVAQSGSTITIAAGATITNSGTATGFGATGAVNWDTTAVTSSPLTAASGVGYFIDTSGGAITVNLPAGVAGAIISLADYTNTWQTNNVTVTPNGSEKIGGVAASAILNVEGQSVTFIYVDATEGWKNVQDSTSNVTGISYVAATGGTILTCGDFKTHVFTGPGTFTVTCAGTPTGSNTVEYLVVAGGGGGGKSDVGGAGGAGGYRQNYPSPAVAGSPVTATGYPITVGSGGAGKSGPLLGPGTSGSNSIFSTITSTGGGYGGGGGTAGGSGGSGGGGGLSSGAGGAGNTPPVSPPQGNNGGTASPGAGAPIYGSGGGGGASAVGTNGSGSVVAPGGAGSPIATVFFGPTSPSYGTPGPAPGRYFAGGGGGARDNTGTGGDGGAGGGGAGGSENQDGINGTTNTGGGGGGGADQPTTAGSGGSGIVLIRYKFQ